MSKQLYSSRYVLKINSSELRLNEWNLKRTLQEARDNEELISLGDSQLLRFIRRLTGMNYTEEDIQKVKKEIKKLKKENNISKNKEKIKEEYEKLDNMLYIKDYIGIVFDNKADFDRATGTKGLTINGIRFKRLLGTTGGIKKNTVMFCSEGIHTELNRLLDNGRNKDIPLVPAKFEAYKSLSASASTPVTQPKGILVIKDGITRIKDKVIRVFDNGYGGFEVEHNVDYEADKDFTDGAGMIKRSLSEQWAIDLGLCHKNKEDILVADYIPSGFNTRYSFEKGMLGTFEFEEFGRDIAKNYIVKDAWGNDIDIREVEIVLTTNMLKLWNAYDNIEDYMKNCNDNGYEFSVTKVCPKELEEKRNMNYQYLQSYEDMTDEDIDELTLETINEVKSALGDDYRKSILFSRGSYITNSSITKSDYDYMRALMINKNVIEDSFIKGKIYGMIEKRIKDAKKGIISVDGNYSIMFGDLYALCESMFEMEVKGLLKFGEFYSKAWTDKSVKEIVAFRSPMTSHNNIKRMKLVNRDDVSHWFKYMNRVTILNAWDTTTDALNGADFDSDAIITTNNPVILRCTRDELAIVCEQKSVPKMKVTETLIRKSNKNGFGDDIGAITNRVTAMFDVLASLKKGSKEYLELMDRIICGQAYQQESIDKIKGIEAKQMPKEWYDYKVNKILEDDDMKTKAYKNNNIKLMVNKKPYFFIHNYKQLMSKYRKFIKDTDNNCIIRYGCDIDELNSKDNKEESEIKFLKGIQYKSPVFKNNCVMNRICWKIEEEFKDVKLKIKENKNFDISLYKSSKKYKKDTYREVGLLFKEYKKQQKQYSQTIGIKASKEEKLLNRNTFVNNFKTQAEIICSNSEELCNIVIDMIYKSNNNRQFAWDICGETIINNLLNKNNRTYIYPVKDKDGDIEWQGHKFKMKEMKVKEEICEE